MRSWVVLTVAMGVLSVTSVAAAQDQAPTYSSKNDKMDSWVFPDDKLLTTPLGDARGKIVIGPPVVRIILTRPRVQFIPELLKTIEGI